jgi:methyl-accepting chemotaxis protein
MIHMSGDLNKMIGDMVAGVSVTTDILAKSTEEFSRDAEDMLVMNKSVDQSVQPDQTGGTHPEARCW